MNRTLLFVASAACLVLPPGPGPQGGQEPRPTVSEATRAASKKLVAQMQGAWRLVDMHLVDAKAPNVPEAGLKHVGYCLVSGSFLAIELHIGIVGASSQTVARSFVSGVHRFEFDASSRMETSSVIGTSLDIDGKPVFEPPNTKRHYRIEMGADRMTLRRDDGHTLSFERMLDDRARFDIFGRPIREKKDPDARGKEEPVPPGDEPNPK